MIPNRLATLADRFRWPLLAAYWLAIAVVTHWPKLDVTGGHNEVGTPVIQFDKTMHVIAFGILQWLLLRAIARTPSRLGWAMAALAAGIGYALVDEYTQQWFRRQITWADVTASLIGVAGVTVLWLTPVWTPHDAVRAWRIWITRALWLGMAPTLVFLVTTPRGTGHAIAWMVEWATRPGTYNDKRAHFVLSMVLTWLLAAASPAGRSRPRLSAAVTMIVMGLSAPIIEIVQSRTGRGFEVADVLAHEAGMLVGILAWAVAIVAWRWMRPPRSLAGVPMMTADADPLRSVPTPPAASPVTADEGGAARAAVVDSAPPAGRRFIANAAIVGGLTFLSRITGLIRDSLLGSAFGVSGVAAAFTMGFLVPNLFRRLFGEGALSAAFIPHYTDLRKQNPELAKRFASLCLSLMAVGLGALTLLGELVIWGLMEFRDWHPDTALALRLTAVMLPYMPLICLVAVIGGVLQVHGRFGAPAAAPVMLNVVMTAAILWATWGIDVTADTPHLASAAHFVAWSVVIAGLVQLVWQVVGLLRVTPLSATFTGTGPTARSMLAMMLPMLVGLAVFQLNTFMDSLIAFALAAQDGGDAGFRVLGRYIEYPMHEGAVAALAYAQRLYQFPLGVFGIAVATAIFPALAAAAGEGAKDAANPGEAFARILRQGLRLTMFIGLPAGVGLILLRVPLTRLVYERGAFTPEDTQRVAMIVAAYSSSIWAYSMTHVLTRGFYALKDSRTPLRISMAMMALNFLLNVTLIWPLGVVGLAFSSATTAVGQVVLLLLAVRRRVDRPVDAYVLRGWGMTAALTAVMAAALLAITLGVVDLARTPMWTTAAWLAGLVALGGLIIFGGAWLIGAEELQWLRRRRGRATPAASVAE